MGKVNKTFALMLILVMAISGVGLLIAKPVFAQKPTPPAVSTLGPVELFDIGENNDKVTIFSPNNGSYYTNPLYLNFSVAVVGLFGQFGNVGVSIDGGVVNSVTNFTTESVEPTDEQYWMLTTVNATVELPYLSEGNHTVTVYFGWQYLGVNQRYEVYSLATSNFTIGEIVTPSPSSSNSPSPSRALTPTVPELPLVVVPLLIGIIAVAVIVRHRKTTIAQNL
jgi:hypothetical protein